MNFGTAIRGFGATMDMLDYAEFGTVRATVSAKTDYAVYVEFGTYKDEAQPYLRPAVRQTMRELPDIVSDADDEAEIVNTMAERIADRMRSDVPVDTGTLRNSITVEPA